MLFDEDQWVGQFSGKIVKADSCRGGTDPIQVIKVIAQEISPINKDTGRKIIGMIDDNLEFTIHYRQKWLDYRVGIESKKGNIEVASTFVKYDVLNPEGISLLLDCAKLLSNKSISDVLQPKEWKKEKKKKGFQQ